MCTIWQHSYFEFKSLSVFKYRHCDQLVTWNSLPPTISVRKLFSCPCKVFVLSRSTSNDITCICVSLKVRPLHLNLIFCCNCLRDGLITVYCVSCLLCGVAHTWFVSKRYYSFSLRDVPLVRLFVAWWFYISTWILPVFTQIFIQLIQHASDKTWSSTLCPLGNYNLLSKTFRV